MDKLVTFIRQFTTHKLIDVADVQTVGREYYLTPPAMRALVRQIGHRPIIAGTLLGIEQGDSLKPSLTLLDMLVASNAKRVVVNDKAEWLTICGRPPMFSSIVEKEGDPKPGELVLILNKHKECIGYGKIGDEKGRKGPIIHLYYDIGDFLRRERNTRARPMAHRRR